MRDGFVEIERGVHAGDWVVVSGMQRIKHDMVVKAEKFAEGAPAGDGKQKSESTAAAPQGVRQAARLAE